MVDVADGVPGRPVPAGLTAPPPEVPSLVLLAALSPLLLLPRPVMVPRRPPPRLPQSLDHEGRRKVNPTLYRRAQETDAGRSSNKRGPTHSYRRPYSSLNSPPTVVLLLFQSLRNATTRMEAQ